MTVQRGTSSTISVIFPITFTGRFAISTINGSILCFCNPQNVSYFGIDITVKNYSTTTDSTVPWIRYIAIGY